MASKKGRLLAESETIWRCGSIRFDLDARPLVMGIVNVTPDSFSDGYAKVDQAVAHASKLTDDGADILDVGGESTRPGADLVPESLELDRVVPVIRELVRRFQIPISIDTRRPEVARVALAEGAVIVNNVAACLAGNDAMIPVLEQHDVGYVAMHSSALPKFMQQQTDYANGVVDAVTGELARVGQDLERHGISLQRVLFDPGIGFGKTLEQNLLLMRASPAIAARLKRPLLLGLSRKSWMGQLLDVAVDQRDPYSVMAGLLLNGNAVAVHRVHNVAMMRRGLALSASLTE